jgi:hypothetical protein
MPEIEGPFYRTHTPLSTSAFSAFTRPNSEDTSTRQNTFSTAQAANFACPFSQYNLHHQCGTYQRCGALQSARMGDVRVHVKRNPHKIPVEYCPTCKQHFKDEAGVNIHAPFSCQQAPLSKEAQWFSLYKSVTGSSELPLGPCK